MKRPVALAIIALLAAANSWSGFCRIVAYWHRYQADAALVQADLDGAYARLGRALSWNPDDPTSNVQRATVIQQALANGLPLKDLEGRSTQEVFGAGVAALGRAISLNPADAWGWFNLANLSQGYRSSYIRLERMKRAGAARGDDPGIPPPAAKAQGSLDPVDRLSIAAAAQAMESDPSFFFYHDFLANLYWDRGLIPEAEAQMVESMTLTPRLAAHTLLQNDAIVEGMAEPLLRGIERSRENPFVGAIMMERARAELLNRLGRYEEAIASYEALRKQGGAPLAQECDLALGKLQQREDRWRESLPILERAHQRNPSTPLGVSALYYMALAYERLEEPARAAEYLEKHLANAPDALAGYHTLARVKEKLGDPKEARRLYIAAVRRFPGSREAYERAIDSLESAGELRQALLYAEALRHLEPGNEQVEERIRSLTEKLGAARRR